MNSLEMMKKASFIDMRRKDRKSSIPPSTKIEINSRSNFAQAGATGNYSSFDNDGFRIPSNLPEPGTSQVRIEKTPDDKSTYSRRSPRQIHENDGYPDLQDPDEYFPQEEEADVDEYDISVVTPNKRRSAKEKRFVRQRRQQSNETDENSVDEDYSINLTPTKNGYDNYKDVPDLVDDADTTKEESFNTSENALLEDELDDDFQVDSEEMEEDGDYVDGLAGAIDDSGSGESSSESESDEDDAGLSARKKNGLGGESGSDVYDSDEDYIQSQAKELLKEGDDSISKNGIRRSTRVKVAPLEYWRNEKIVYKRKSDKPVLEIDKIITYEHNEDDDEEEEYRSSKKKKEAAANKTKTRPYNYIPSGKPRGRPPKSKQISNDTLADPNALILKEIQEGSFPNSEWLKQGILQSTVNVTIDKQQSDEIVAFAPGLSQTEQLTQTSDDNFSLSILFDKHKERFASGMLRLPIKGEKDIADSHNAFITFYLIKGIVQVTIGENNFVCTEGASFQIPAFNKYAFVNKGKAEAHLFFVQVTVPEDFNGAEIDDSFIDTEISINKSPSDMSLTST